MNKENEKKRKVRLVPLSSDATLFERKIRTSANVKSFFCSSLDLEWKLEHLRGRENHFCFLPDLEWKLGHVRS